MPRPLVFIGSSKKNIDVARAIQAGLENCETEIWDQGVFGPSKGILEGLLEGVKRYHFAILVLTRDDISFSNGKMENAPRDNVLFELGLFMGKLGKERTFIVKDKSAKLKLPSDLQGIITADYMPPSKDGNLEAAVGTACFRINKEITKIKKNKPAQQQKPLEEPRVFSEGIKILNDVGAVLENEILPIIRNISAKGKAITIENFGLDLETVLPWINTKIVRSNEFDHVRIVLKCLIINGKSPYLKDLINGGSNISSETISHSINTANDFSKLDDLSMFELEMRQYDLPPITHGFIINDTHLFLGFTEIDNKKLVGGIKPYVYIQRLSNSFSPLGVHYYKCFKSWFDYYWNLSKPVAHVKK